MKVNEFNPIYEYAKKVIILEDDYLKCSGWIWLNLTEKQHKKMYGLLLSQGAKEQVNAAGRPYIQLGGLGIMKWEDK
jgi:hypothetical protein